MKRRLFHTLIAGFMLGSTAMISTLAVAQSTIDNSALTRDEFRAHKATYGLVYTLPKDATDVLDNKINGFLKQRLIELGLVTEAKTPNIPHVTVVHVHSADPSTPGKMLKSMPPLPPVINLTLKNFYTTEQAKDAGRPWWLDLGIVKSGKGFDDMMAFNTVATAALTPLRDGPLPRCTGPAYARMSDAAKDLVKSGGEWISSIDLENAAVAHPAVAMAAVIGVKHPKWDERPLLFVVRKPGAALEKEEILGFLAERVAKWWVPDDVVFLESLPVGGTGKVQKADLRKQYGGVFS